jgi:alpha/beta superfamily hydrolase
MSIQRKLWIEGPAGRLEASMRVALPARAAAVVAHPHPLHGGTLHNPVVFHCERALYRAGLTTLRFNFRGVGTSDGTHDEGRGEVDDLAAAVTWLRGISREVPLIVVGYSFGSRCGLRLAARERDVAGLVAIGFPVRLEDLSAEVAALPCPFAVVQGSADEFGSPAEVGTTVASADPPALVLRVEGADHLFTGLAAEAGERVVEAVEALLA